MRSGLGWGEGRTEGRGCFVCGAAPHTSAERRALTACLGRAEDTGGADVGELLVDEDARGDGVEGLAEELRGRLPVAWLHKGLGVALVRIRHVDGRLRAWHDRAGVEVGPASPPAITAALAEDLTLRVGQPVAGRPRQFVVGRTACRVDAVAGGRPLEVSALADHDRAVGDVDGRGGAVFEAQVVLQRRAVDAEPGG